MKIGYMEVKLRLGNKLYSAGATSASGKTYLYKLLKSYNTIPENRGRCLLITYDEGMSKEYLLERIENFTGEFIFLDRFDMYYDKRIIDTLISKNIPVLLDLKDYSRLNEFPVRPVEIILSKDSLEVIGL